MSVIQILGKYESYFHDADLANIQHVGNEIILTMQSAEIWKEHRQEINSFIELSPNFRIIGKLHFIGIKKLMQNGQSIKILEYSYDDYEISHLEIKNNCVSLLVIGNSYPEKRLKTEWIEYEIEADNIFWENLPNMVI